MDDKVKRLLLVSIVLLYSPGVLAYIGPGSGLSAIGSLLAIVGTFLLIIVGFFWFPLKRQYLYLNKKLRNENLEIDEPDKIEPTDEPS